MDLKPRLEREFLPYVIKPARYLGNEYNTTQKKLSDVELRIALCFPAIYEQGMADFKFEIIYYVLNSHPNIWSERFFLPSQDAITILREKDIPLFSLETKTALSEFHIIIFSIRSELHYTALLNMLRAGNIPIYSRDRSADLPLVIGTANFKWNPQPVADFIDVALIGNWELEALHLCQIVLNVLNEKKSKPDLLNQLVKLKGVYIPAGYQENYNIYGEYSNLEKLDESFPDVIESVCAADSNSKSYSIEPLFPIIRVDYSQSEDETFVEDSFGDEHENNIGKPFNIDAQFQQSLHKRNSPEDKLMSILTANSELIWKEIKEQVFLSNQKLSFSYPDFKIEKVSFPEIQFLKREEACIYAGAGSKRLRTLINRHYRDEDLCNLMSLLIQAGFSKIRLEFLIGFPTEKEDDITQLINFIKECVGIVKTSEETQLTVQISPFIPKPYSIFQWEGMESRQNLQTKYDLLENNLTNLNINLCFEDIQKSLLKAMLQRGSRSLSEIIEAASQSLPSQEEKSEDSNFSIWENALNAKSKNWKKLLEPISVTMPLPWDHIDYGISKYHLKTRRLNALQGKIDTSISSFVHLGKGVPREEFENLVKNSGVKAVENNQPVKSIADNQPAETIQYGRTAHRQVKPVAPIKKKIRVQYTKTGPAKFISHLDAARVFELAARKACISLVYTQGKTPHPKFSFGPPLPIGITSLAEYLDLEIEIKDESENYLNMNLYFPEGVKIVKYKTLFAKVPALSAVINLADYKISWDNSALSAQLVSDWMNSDEIWIEAIVKDEMQKINVRPYIAEMRIDNNQLFIRTRKSDEKIARITEILSSLQSHGGIDPTSFVIQRVGQFVENDGEILTPLEVV